MRKLCRNESETSSRVTLGGVWQEALSLCASIKNRVQLLPTSGVDSIWRFNHAGVAQFIGRSLYFDENRCNLRAVVVAQYAGKLQAKLVEATPFM